MWTNLQIPYKEKTYLNMAFFSPQFLFVGWALHVEKNWP